MLTVFFRLHSVVGMVRVDLIKNLCESCPVPLLAFSSSRPRGYRLVRGAAEQGISELIYPDQDIPEEFLWAEQKSDPTLRETLYWP